MKILFLSPIAAVGGAERVLATMMAMLRRHRPEATIGVLTLGDGPLVDQLRGLGATVEALPVPASLATLGDSGIGLVGKFRSLVRAAAALPGLWKLRRDFRRAVDRFGPDVVHSNGIKTHLLASLSGLSMPVVWHVHDLVGMRPLAGKLLKWYAGRMTEAIAISQAVADDFRRVVGPRPISLIPNAIDLERFRPGLDGIPDLRSADGQLQVGMVATYARWKGHEIFLEAAAKVLCKLPKLPVRFCVIGGPVYQTAGSQYTRKELQSLAERLGISVQFIGFQSEVERVYSSLDVVVHASTKPEPFGLTIVEAMACGRPVIASLAGGVGEIVDDGKDGMAVPPGDAEALASAIATLLQDADLRARLAVNARSKAERLFDQSRLGPQLWTVYRRCVQPKNMVR